jgi:hypothetical protein
MHPGAFAHPCFHVVLGISEKVLQRGEKIELLVDKTDALSQSAFQFKKQAKQVKNVMWWKNVKIMCIIGLICLVRDVARWPSCVPM